MERQPWKIDRLQCEERTLLLSLSTTDGNIKNKFQHQISTRYNTDEGETPARHLYVLLLFQTHLSEPFHRVVGTKSAMAKSCGAILNDTYDGKIITEFYVSFWGVYLGKQFRMCLCTTWAYMHTSRHNWVSGVLLDNHQMDACHNWQWQVTWVSRLYSSKLKLYYNCNISAVIHTTAPTQLLIKGHGVVVSMSCACCYISGRESN